MDVRIDLDCFREAGWLRIKNAVPATLCDQLVHVLESELDVPVNDPARWGEYGGEWRDLIPIWGHQAQWDIRQHPNMHQIWATLWGRKALWVSLDSCRFTPPWKPGYAQEPKIHWDHDPWDASARMFGGVLALTNTALDQGGFRCVPSLYHDRETWPKQPVIDADGDENWLADTTGHTIEYVAADVGDLIVWDYRLPHSNSKNTSTVPRLAFYVVMFPTTNPQLREANVESWRTGRCVPWWRTRRGYDRVELWRHAKLTALGRKLLGLDEW
jgi:hypothetical protein